MPSEVATQADFATIIRYAQVWEDADILLEGLDIGPEDDCLSICSAGDNALSMLARHPRRVVAVDMNPSQLACLELRVAAFRVLEWPEVLELIGSRPSERRGKLYETLRTKLSARSREFWDDRSQLILAGAGSLGKFENYFRLFRERIMPLVHSRKTILRLLESREREGRHDFYATVWNSWRWRFLFQLFFSRTVMGRLGRDPRLFQYVEGSVAEKILSRTKHALTELDPADNPYLQWILTGQHLTALPFYLREENFESIRSNLDRLEWSLAPLEDFLSARGEFSKFNLSDIFEYMSEEASAVLLEKIADAARPGARLAYWNMLAPRWAPERLGHRLKSLPELSASLHLRDKAFFYSAFIVEEVR